MAANIKKNYKYIICFLIPFLIFIKIFQESGIYPFNDFSYLDGDLFQQYMPFITDLRRRLLNNESLTYSFNLGLGLPYSPIISYYLASPLNLIFVLINPLYIIDTIDFMIIIKLSLCAVTFCYFLSKKYENSNLLIISVSICYALSSYMCTYCYNIMWLDALIIFPLVVLGLQNIYGQRKYKLYFFSLFVTILSNYYIAIIVCIFSFLYFTILVIVNEKRLEKKEIVYSVRLFFRYSLLAGFSAAVAIFPAMIALSSTASGELNFPATIEFYNSFFVLISRFAITVPKSVVDNFPNLYCSVLFIITLPLYLLNRNINIRHKFINLFLIVFMLISININILEYVWHGFHFPNFICNRNSFIFIFFALVISYEALINISSANTRSYIVSVICSALFISSIWLFHIKNKDTAMEYSERTVVLTVFFIVVYCILIFFLMSGYKKKNVILVLLLATTGYELYMNAGPYINSTVSRTPYISRYTRLTDFAGSFFENDNGFYRVEDTQGGTANYGALINYRSASCFTSTANKNITDLYKALGLRSSTNYYSFRGHTPITTSLFAVKYMIADSKIEDTDITDFYTKCDNTQVDCYKYNYALPVGFMVSDSFSDADILASVNPFDNLNTLYSAIVEKDDTIFYSIPCSVENDDYSFVVPEDNPVYFKYDSPKGCQMTATITHANGEIRKKGFSKNNHISYLGQLKKGDKVTITITDNRQEYHGLDLYVSYFEKSKMETFYRCASENTLEVAEYTDTSISGTIEADTDGLLFTSIPYDKHWNLYVDGKKTPPSGYKDTLITIKLDKGTHRIELEYDSSYNYIGIIISVISLSIFLGLELLGKSFHKPG